MPFQRIIKVANPSPDRERSDFVEVDLDFHGVPEWLDEKGLRLSRFREGKCEEVPYQIDYPLGRDKCHRVLTFFSLKTPPGPDDYSRHTAEFLLEEKVPGDWSASVCQDDLCIQHFYSLGVPEKTWHPEKRVIGVKLDNGGSGENPVGLQAYFSLVPRPEDHSLVNYAGAVTSLLHHRAHRMTDGYEAVAGGGEALSPFWNPKKELARWGQLTRLDFYSLPWERNWYQAESLLGQPGQEPEYTLAWSNSGPLRATVTLKSQPIHVEYISKPFFHPDATVMTCYLYRIICFYPKQEFYTEQLIVRPEGEEVPQKERISLAFRAHYCSFVDYPPETEPDPARLEHIPDYFAIWRHFAVHHRGYAFASDSHIRALKVMGPEFQWRLELGHEHRCIHLFPFHCYPDGEFDRFHEVGHTAWFEGCYKPVQVVPLNRYLVHRK